MSSQPSFTGLFGQALIILQIKWKGKILSDLSRPGRLNRSRLPGSVYTARHPTIITTKYVLYGTKRKSNDRTGWPRKTELARQDIQDDADACRNLNASTANKNFLYKRAREYKRYLIQVTIEKDGGTAASSNID